jgi:hypothetical protein
MIEDRVTAVNPRSFFENNGIKKDRVIADLAFFYKQIVIINKGF